MDKEVIRYLALAEEKLMNYANALSAMRELIAIEDNLDNNIKLGELLMLNKEYETAINYLQRTLQRSNNQGADVIQKLIGDCYYASGNYAYAADKYFDVIQINFQAKQNIIIVWEMPMLKIGKRMRQRRIMLLLFK